MHIENGVVLVLVGVVMLLRWLLQKGTADDKSSASTPANRTTTTPQRTVTPVQRAPAESEEQRIRRFLEALGQPATSMPPPKVTPRRVEAKASTLPHVKPFASPLPPLTTRPPEEPRPKQVFFPGSPVPQVVKEFVSTSAKAAPAPVAPRPPSSFEIGDASTALPDERAPVALPEQYQVARKLAPAATGTADWRALLRSNGGLREAVILREIFGPPRSLQALDELRSF